MSTLFYLTLVVVLVGIIVNILDRQGRGPHRQARRLRS
jgi:hypothetical protein